MYVEDGWRVGMVLTSTRAKVLDGEPQEGGTSTAEIAQPRITHPVMKQADLIREEDQKSRVKLHRLKAFNGSVNND